MAEYYRRLTRCKSESNLLDRNLNRRQRSKSLNDVQYSAALDEQMRDSILRLTKDLEEEQRNVAAMKRENVLHVMAAREEELGQARSAHEDLALQMLQEKNEAIKEVEHNAKVIFYQELDRVKKEKDEELRRAKREWEYEKEILLNSLNDQVRNDIRVECEEEFERVRKKNEMEYFNLVSQNRMLQEDLKIAKQADREKAEEIRRILQDQNKLATDLKRDASLDSRRQLSEMREMQKVIDQLEKKLGLESGSCLRLQMEKESLDEALSRLKLADSWDKRISKSHIRGIGDVESETDINAALTLRLSARPHNDPERVLHRRVVELSSLVRRLDENNQQIVARNQELIEENENSKNERDPLQQKAKRLGAKNMELVQTNRRQEERINLQQDEILSLKDKLKTYEDLIGKRDKELSKLKNKLKAKIDVEAMKDQIETLESAVQEQLQIIFELRQQSVEKDRRLDVLRERIQRKHSKKCRKGNGRKSTSPDSLNDVCIEEDSLSVSSEMSAVSNTEDRNETSNGADISARENENYTRLCQEKMELDRAYNLLQQQSGGFQDPEHTQLQTDDGIQSDLLVAQARIQDLVNQLEVANSNNNNKVNQQTNTFQEERQKLRTANKIVHDKLITAESELLSKTLEITRLKQDLIDVEEQRDLLEFRIMELEHMARPKSPDIESLQLTDDDKIHMTQDTEEVEGDAISVRIALKELEINKQSLLSPKETSALVQAVRLVEKGEKESQNLQSSEKRLKRRVNELEGKYNNLKIKYAEKENEQVLLTAVTTDEEDRKFILNAEIFEFEESLLEKANGRHIEMQKDQEKNLKKALKRITELEDTNAFLQQTLRRYDNNKSAELSDNEIDILNVKVEELKDATKRVNELEIINSHLEHRIEEFETEKAALQIIEEVVESNEIPNSIALEIKDLKEENDCLSEELSTLRNRKKETVFSFERERQTVCLIDCSTQTIPEDETPWHKYMSPRSERSLSRSDGIFTPRSQCNEGTQTPRIYEGENQSDRLTLEEPLKSAPVVEDLHFEIELSSMPTDSNKIIQDMSSWSVENIKYALDTSSTESLFRFADHLVKEATDQAKETLREELSLSFISNSSHSRVEFPSPSDVGHAKQPGEMIDMYMGEYKQFNKYQGNKRPGGIKDQGRSLYDNDTRASHNGFDFKGNELAESPSRDLRGRTLSLEFDPLQIETSSVDENSYTRQPLCEEPCFDQNDVNNTQGVLKVAEPSGWKNDIKICKLEESPVGECDHYDERDQNNFNKNQQKFEEDRSIRLKQCRSDSVVEGASWQQSSRPQSSNPTSCNAAHISLETSGSVASTDIDELLCYGAALRDYHSGGYNITSSFEEESTLIDNRNASNNPSSQIPAHKPNKATLHDNHSVEDIDDSYENSRHFVRFSNEPGNEGTLESNESLAEHSAQDSPKEKDIGSLLERRGDNLVLPTFHFSPVEDADDNYMAGDVHLNQGENENSFDSIQHCGDVFSDGELDSFQHQRRASRFGSSTPCYNELATNANMTVMPKRSDRRQSQHFSDSLQVGHISNRLRSRSWSPMRRCSLKRPRSHSAGSVFVPFSERLSGKRNSLKIESSSNFSLDNAFDRNSSSKNLDSKSYKADLDKMDRCKINEPISRKDSISPANYGGTTNSRPRSHIQNLLRSANCGPYQKDRSNKEMNMLREECASLERQLKNKDAVMKTMKAELKEEVENIALLEKKEKTIQEKAESNAYLTQELQRCQKELDGKNSEVTRKDFEINKLKTEVRNLEISKKHTEKSFSEVQVQVNQIEISERKLVEVQEQHDIVLLRNKELIERVKHLEIAEKEFIELERNVIDLQEQLRDMENVEAHRDELYGKFNHLKRQRDDFLKKGRMVEEERNDFMRTNQSMEQHLEEYKKKFSNIKKTNGELNRRILVLEREKKDVETKILDVQNDRNIMQTALGKLEIERDDLIREVKEVTSERIILEQKLTEMDEMLSDHDHLEEGFHSLRLKLAELTRQRDDAEMLIPSLKAKIALLKKSCREKDETVTRYVEELKHVKYNIASSSVNDKSKARQYEYSSQPSSRTKHKSSYFIETNREENHHSKPRRIEYEFPDDSVQLSEEDQSISEDGSIIIDRRNLVDTRAQTGRTVRVYEQRSRPVGRSKNYKAMFDYDPYKSSSSIHPERELKLKEGEYITVYGEMDVDGYLEAEVGGETGLVPSIYVEEFEEDGRSMSRPNETRNVTVQHSHGQRQRKFVSLYDYDPFTMGRTGRPEQQLSLRKGDVVTVIGDIDIDGYYTAELNGRSGLVPSNFMRELGGSQMAASSSYGGQKTYEQQQQTTRNVEHRNTSSSRNGTIEVIRDDVIGPPYPPSNFKIIRVVNKDSALLTWKLPQMDKFGRSNGALITGYKIWVNGRPKQEVKSHTMTKAIVSGLNLRDKLDFDIQTVGENGFCSEKCHYNITGAYSLLNPVYEEFFAKAPGNYRTFVSLYDYDPLKSSPNPNPTLELGFSEGDLLKVFDTTRSDGFYQAELRGKSGLVPSNFLEEISVPDNLYSRGSESYSATGETSQGLRSGYSHSSQQQQQRHSSSSEYEKRSSLSTGNGARKRKMVAVYDYDPLRQSPSKDKSKELNLRKGQYVTVVGDMRPDGFYLGEIDGRQGLVPGDFLEPQKDDDGESRRVQFASGADVK